MPTELTNGRASRATARDAVVLRERRRPDRFGSCGDPLDAATRVAAVTAPGRVAHELPEVVFCGVSDGDLEAHRALLARRAIAGANG